MLKVEYQCQRCGNRFEETVLDRKDPKEVFVQGVPIRCPNCASGMIEQIRVKSHVANDVVRDNRRAI